jgi:hypothetical protein
MEQEQKKDEVNKKLCAIKEKKKREKNYNSAHL